MLLYYILFWFFSGVLQHNTLNFFQRYAQATLHFFLYQNFCGWIPRVCEYLKVLWSFCFMCSFLIKNYYGKDAQVWQRNAWPYFCLLLAHSMADKLSYRKGKNSGKVNLCLGIMYLCYGFRLILKSVMNKAVWRIYKFCLNKLIIFKWITEHFLSNC